MPVGHACFRSRALPGRGTPPNASANGAGSSSTSEELRVMFSDFSAAAALSPPEFRTANSRITAQVCIVHACALACFLCM